MYNIYKTYHLSSDESENDNKYNETENLEINNIILQNMKYFKTNKEKKKKLFFGINEYF